MSRGNRTLPREPDCPDRDQLTRFFHGALGAHEAQTVRAHARQCKSCAAWLRRLQEEMDTIRGAFEDMHKASFASLTPEEAAMAIDALRPPAPPVRRYRRPLAWAATALLAVGIIGLVSRPQCGQMQPPAPTYSPHLAPPPARGFALVIRSAEVRGDALRCYADKDGARFARMLPRQVGLAADHVRLLGANASVAAIREGMRWLARSAGREDTVYVFIAGFADSSSGSLLFAARDGQLPMKELLAELSRLPVHRVVAVVDCCFAASSIDELMAAQRPAPAPYERHKAPTRPKMVVLASCASYQKSWNDTLHQGSYFTRFLLDALEGRADADRNGRVSADEVHNYLRAQFRAVALPEPQTPRLYGDRGAILAELRGRKGHLVLRGVDLAAKGVSINGRPLSAWVADGTAAVRGDEVVCTLPLSDKPYEVLLRDRLGRAWPTPLKLTHATPRRQLWVRPDRHDGTRITITYISAEEGKIAGTVEGLANEEGYGIACYVHTDLFYRHPFFAEPLVAIDKGRWQVDHIRRGHEVEVAAVVVRRGSKPGNMLDRLEALDPVATTVIAYSPDYDLRAPAPSPGVPPLRRDGARPVPPNTPSIAVWVEGGRTVHGLVSGLAARDIDKFGVRVYASMEGIWYIQPYLGDVHGIRQDMTFRTWTRAFEALKAELVERATDKVAARATFRPGDPKPARPIEER